MLTKCFVRIDDVNILYYFSVFTKYHCLELQELQDCLVLDNDYNADMLLSKLLSLNHVRHEVPGDGKGGKGILKKLNPNRQKLLSSMKM